MYRIFIVEDDEVIAGAIADKLRSWDFDARICDELQHVTKEFVEYDPQLVLMDISLPFFNGYHWCSEIRKISKLPIMFISSAGDDMNIVMAINMGADDFVSKPFDMDLLLAKIQALLRRAYDFNAQNTCLLQHKDVVLNSASGTVTFGDGRTELTGNENK